MKNYTKLLCAAATMLMLATGAFAEEETPAFYVMTTPEYWGTFIIDYETHTSKSLMGFSLWECSEFATTNTTTVTHPFTDLRFGEEFDGTPYIRNLSPLAHKVDRISVYISSYSLQYLSKCLKCIRLSYGTQSDLSDSKVIEFSGSFTGNKELLFELENPDRMRYYKLELECEGHGASSTKNFYAGLSTVKFYAQPEADGIPVTWESVNENNAKVCNVMAEAGKLHMICYELDSNNNVVSDSSQPQSVRRAEGSIDWTDTSWTNEVADKWEGVTIESPRITGHKMAIRAKAELADGSFSPENQVFFNTDGIFTGIDSPLCDASTDTPAYYTLQGVRVDNPSNGIYIRVARGKAEKVAL